MKKFTLLFLLTFQFAWSHEDQFFAIEKSNIHITLKLDNENEELVNLYSNYAEYLNNYILRNFASEKVYIRMDYDYIVNKSNNYIVGTYTDFKNILPCNFRLFWNSKTRSENWYYPMDFINNNKGSTLVINQSQFDVDKIAKAITYLVELKPQRICVFTENQIKQNLCFNGISSASTEVFTNYASYYLIKDLNVIETKNLTISIKNGKHNIENEEIEPIYNIKNLDSGYSLIFINREEFYFKNKKNSFDSTLYKLNKPTEYFGRIQVSINNEILKIENLENKYIVLGSDEDPITSTIEFQIEKNKLKKISEKIIKSKTESFKNKTNKTNYEKIFRNHRQVFGCINASVDTFLLDKQFGILESGCDWIAYISISTKCNSQ
ncbi:hypothetical protein [Flavobacterium sp. I3-2]|uniref:hypothetical protein n=1 Tax=Flavobacterium sp. I3-2 TaxID=2748319 RepID=UPI0015A8B7E6|nr:hypothetical protein [Flavobacterium sp. I3-2]